MGALTLYGKQFINLGNGRIIPLILTNSFERSPNQNTTQPKKCWRVWCTPELLGDTAAAIRAHIEKSAQTELSEGTIRDWFHAGDNIISTTDVLQWFDSVNKHARTIEDIYRKTGRKIICKTISIDRTTNGYGELCRQICTTTQELLDCITAYNEQKKTSTEELKLRIGFEGLYPVIFPKENKSTIVRNFVIMQATSGMYLLRKEDRRAYLTKLAKDAKPFSTLASAEQFIKKELSKLPSHYQAVAYRR